MLGILVYGLSSSCVKCVHPWFSGFIWLVLFLKEELLVSHWLESFSHSLLILLAIFSIKKNGEYNTFFDTQNPALKINMNITDVSSLPYPSHYFTSPHQPKILIIQTYMIFILLCAFIMTLFIQFHLVLFGKFWNYINLCTFSTFLYLLFYWNIFERVMRLYFNFLCTLSALYKHSAVTSSHIKHLNYFLFLIISRNAISKNYMLCILVLFVLRPCMTISD